MVQIEASPPLSDSEVYMYVRMYVRTCFSMFPNHRFVIERPWLSDIIEYPSLSDIIISSIV